MKRIIIVLIVLLVVGCTQVVPPTYFEVQETNAITAAAHVYSNAVTEKNPLLLPIYNSYIIHVCDIDGKEIGADGKSALNSIYLPEGEHKLGMFVHQIKNNQGGLLGGLVNKLAYDSEKRVLRREITFNFEAGKKYEITYKLKENVSALSRQGSDSYEYYIKESLN